MGCFDLVFYFRFIMNPSITLGNEDGSFNCSSCRNAMQRAGEIGLDWAGTAWLREMDGLGGLYILLFVS